MISPGALQAVGVGVDEDPGLLQDLIDRATAFVKVHTRRYFGVPVIVKHYLSGNGSRLLRLPEAVNDDITAVEERCGPGDDLLATLTTEFEIQVRGEDSYLVRTDGSCWRRGYEYAMTYEMGYEVDSGPKDIEQLIIDLVSLRLANRDREGLSGETIGGYQYTRPAIYAFADGDLKQIPGAFATIQAWRRPVFA